MHHSVQAAAMTKRRVVAPTMSCLLRHCSRPRPSKVLVSRMVIATAHRSPYSRQMACVLKESSVRKKASTDGGNLL